MRESCSYKKIGDVATFKRGLTYSGKDEVSFSQNVVLRSNNIDLATNTLNLEELKFISSDICIPEDKKLKANSIFMCMSNGSKQHLGKVAFIDHDMSYAFGGFMGLIIPKQDVIYPKYLYFYFCSPQFKDVLKSIGNGININNIKFVDIAKNSIIIPSFSEQQHIVSELENINELIRLKKAQLNDLDALALNLFYEMFGDPLNNEKGWKIRTLKEFIKVIGGYAFKSNEFKEDGIPVLRIGNINSGVFKPSNLVFWNKDDKLSRYRIIPGDLVISLTGTVGKSDYGNICILDDTYKEYYLNQRNAKLEICGDIDKIYLSRIMKFDSIKSKLTNISRGVRQANIANKDIENLQIPLPPLSLQQSFASRIANIEYQKQLIYRSITDLEYLFASRMQYWFN